MKSHSIGFIGLGVMGYPMAGHLASAGHKVTVFNRTRSKAEKWVSEHSGAIADSPQHVAMNADFVLACVGNDSDVREVTLGSQGAFSSMQANAVFIDHTTASADIARELVSTANANGFNFIDAPVSGGQAGAENGVLTIMAGGQQESYDRVEPILSCYAKFIQRMGGAGAGQLAKMVNQICIAGLVQSLSEGVAFAKNAELDCDLVFAALSQGAASSWQMINRHETMSTDKFNFGFAVDWMRKDLGLCINEAKRNGSALPVAELVDSYYAEIQQNGGNRLDTSSLVMRLPKRSSTS